LVFGVFGHIKFKLEKDCISKKKQQVIIIRKLRLRKGGGLWVNVKMLHIHSCVLKTLIVEPVTAGLSRGLERRILLAFQLFKCTLAYLFTVSARV
jgi:hypothetical protein